ncbi:hypothetical protein TKK_0010315 [Trichogramma kaykai]
MKFFAKHELFENPASNLEERLRHERHFERLARETMITPRLSLYDSIRLRPEQLAKVLGYSDCLGFACSPEFTCISIERHGKDCFLHLCKIMSRGFFRRWAVPFFEELTHYRLPILCSNMIIDHLTNDDLFNICLAAS